MILANNFTYYTSTPTIIAKIKFGFYFLLAFHFLLQIERMWILEFGNQIVNMDEPEPESSGHSRYSWVPGGSGRELFECKPIRALRYRATFRKKVKLQLGTKEGRTHHMGSILLETRRTNAPPHLKERGPKPVWSHMSENIAYLLAKCQYSLNETTGE